MLEVRRAARALASSAANSDSLTFVPTDFVLSEGFIAHRRFDSLGIGGRDAGRAPPTARELEGSGPHRADFSLKRRRASGYPFRDARPLPLVTRFQRFCCLAACFLMVPAPVTGGNLAAPNLG